MNIAIIPARGGSKRIPRKNCKEFLGVPIIERTILKMQSSDIFDEIYVSTEDDEIANLAMKSRVRVLKRNLELSDDYTSTVSVIADAVSQIKEDTTQTEARIVCVYPATPLLDYKHVRHALEILENVTDGYVFSAAPFETPVERSFRLDKNGNLEVLFPEFLQARTQDLKTNYRDAGQFYGAVLSTWERQLPIFNSKSRFIAMQEYETIDIDTPSDWIFAEELFKLRGFS